MIFCSWATGRNGKPAQNASGLDTILRLVDSGNPIYVHHPNARLPLFPLFIPKCSAAWKPPSIYPISCWVVVVGGGHHKSTSNPPLLLLGRRHVPVYPVELGELGAAGLAFETAVGRNGKIWVNSNSDGDDKDRGKGKGPSTGGDARTATKTILLVGRALRETDERNLTVDQQKKLVRKLVKDMS